MKSGFESASKSWGPSEHLKYDLRGKHVMITGANSGIGYETAKQLAKQGALVHMVCRNEVRGLAARDLIRAEIEGESEKKVNLTVCDVSNQRDIQKLVTDFTKSNTPLHVLVNNAGCMVHTRMETSEGIETSYATNAVGVYALTSGLTPVLRKTSLESNSPSRVICVASAGMLTEKIELDDPEMHNGTFDGTRQYAKNKRTQVALIELFGKREESENRENGKIIFLSQHPGWSDTAALKVALPGFYDSLKAKLRSPWEGADTVVWLATCKAELINQGGFYFDRKEVAKHVSFNALTGTTYSDKQVLEMESRLKETCDKAIGGKA